MHSDRRRAGTAALLAAVLLAGVSLAWVSACPAAAGGDEWHRVAYVNDGDTVVLAGPGNQALRYIGVDTPEIDHRRQTAEPFGFEARRFNRELVLDRRVRLEFDRERSDRHGRRLAYVFLEDGTFVNQAILAAGYGFCLSKKPNTRYEKMFLESQRAAMEAGRGLWEGWSETGGDYVGNRESRLFHRPDCPNAKKISPRNRLRFDTQWEAYWSGYAPARECMQGTKVN